MKYSTLRKNRFNKKYLLPVLGVLIVAAGFVVYRVQHNNQPTDVTVDTATDKIDLSPPTEADKQEVEEHKAELGDNAATPPPPATGLTVTPTIVDANQYDSVVEVRAFVSGVYESGGVCTFTFTKGSTTVTKQKTAEKDASYTRCPNLSIPTSEFKSSGEWNLVVAYSSPSAKGSASRKVTINP